MKRISLTLLWIVLAFGALLTFPQYIPWMVFLWLIIAIGAGAKSKPMWPWLTACVVIIVVKRPGFTIEYWSVLIVFSVVAFIDWKSRPVKAADREIDGKPMREHKHQSKRLAAFATVLITVAAYFAAARWLAANTTARIVSDGRAIACLGDSLTDYGYPQELEKLITVPVADFGVNGITTDAGIEMIPEILAANPQIVVIELGGHDYNGEDKTRAATGANLEELITAFRAEQIAVILIEIPRGFISDPYDGLERELAAKYDLQLIDDSVIRSFIFNSPILPPGLWRSPSQRYSKDGLHPNALGNRHFAKVVNKAIDRVLLPLSPEH